MNDKVLVDADALYALINPKDANHKKASKINQSLIVKRAQFVITNLVIYEVATLLSYRLTQAIAVNFINDIVNQNFEIHNIYNELEQETLAIFKNQTQKRISMVDCANIAVMKKRDLAVIFSFDEFYKRNGLKRAGVD